MLRVKIICLSALLCIMYFCVPVYASEEGGEVDSTTEEAPSLNDQIVNNALGDLGTYWHDSSLKLTESKNEAFHEGGIVFQAVMKFSNFCRRAGWILAILSILVGGVMYLISGLNKVMKRAAVFLMIGFPVIMLTIAFAVPITASIFFYGR